MTTSVLAALDGHLRRMKPAVTVETGSGKTSLLFGRHSAQHTIFALDGGNGSIDQVRNSDVFQGGDVVFVEGPTQTTLPTHTFDTAIDMVLLDGPHGYPFPELEYYYVYPHLRPGGLLILDDIHIPTIHHMFEVLRQDDMFTLVEVVDQTAFLQRTTAPTFNPLGDGWWEQNVNKEPVSLDPKWKQVARKVLPETVRKPLREVRDRVRKRLP